MQTEKGLRKTGGAESFALDISSEVSGDFYYYNNLDSTIYYRYNKHVQEAELFLTVAL